MCCLCCVLYVQALNTSLISQRKMMGRESILTVRSQASAENATSALTKKIYSNMFNWLITRINATLGVNAKGANRVVGVVSGPHTANETRALSDCV